MQYLLRFCYDLLPSILLTGILVFINTGSARAAHLIGGELTYECLSNNQFKITLTIYRDCYSTGAYFDNPAYLTVFNASGSVINNIDMYDPEVVQMPVTTEGLCIETVPDVCVERGVYETNINLPPLTGGYRIVYQRCCRNNTIVNIVNPGGTGSTYVANIPQSALGPCNNSSPVFNNYPPIAICANSPLVFDHSATDADGDSLVYSICEPFSGASTADPQPPTASSPPWETIEWLAPYSATDQLGGSPVMSIDPVTGLLTAFPDQLGQYVVGICVSEYRNGMWLSTNLRDFQFNVTNCAVVLADANVSADSVSICLGQSITLEGEAFGGNVYQWSPATGLSNPNVLNPIASPTQNTTYTLTVINPAVGCQDTDEVTVIITEETEADAGPDATICAGDAVILNGSGTPGNTFLWWPATGLSDPFIANPVATPAQTTTYTLIATNANGCAAQDSVTVTVIGGNLPVTVPDITICPGQTGILSVSGGSFSGYQWSNGASTAQIAVSEPGQYSVTVTGMVNGCPITAAGTATVSLQEAATTVTIPNITICPGQSGVLGALGGSFSGYQWSTGATSEQILVSNIGQYSVTVSETVNGCEVTASDTATVTTYAAPEPVIGGNFSFITGQSAVLLVQQGFAAYLWSNGQTTPAITVTSGGQYAVTVTDANGCIGSTWAAVAEEPRLLFTIPSAFTPNNDGMNDTFMVIANPADIEQVNLYVYNRWGQEIFSAGSLSTPWNGKYKAQDCEMGVYVYYGSVTLKGGEVKELKGNVTLIR
ncbi:hypothetical protein C7N43_36830 [Sphingobacteriales bacterium UPWRP_1]|nr:hypothetical protein C7N43_36830 [Sphingobacteriales bacterium UPWRP_1]